MEDLAASIMSLSQRHSAPLYLFFDVPTFPKHHGGVLHDEGDGGFEFAAAAGAKNVDDDDSSAAPRACASDVSIYADELFRGGVLLPLKLPPRLQRPTASSTASSAATSPTAALGRVQSWSPFSSSRRHRGFDPFVAALKKVRRDGVAPAPRRSRSLSPLRGAAATTSSNSSGTAADAQKTSACRPPWRRRRGVKHILCTAVMPSPGAAPRAQRPRRRRDGGGPYRPGLLGCFGF